MQETNPTNALVVQGLDVHIEGDHILKHVDVTFPAHRITCIVGPSGCGKSTLLRSLNRLTENIDNFRISGRILIGGQDIVQARDAELIELRRRVGLVPQRPCPLPMSIFDNVRGTPQFWVSLVTWNSVASDLPSAILCTAMEAPV